MDTSNLVGMSIREFTIQRKDGHRFDPVVKQTVVQVVDAYTDGTILLQLEHPLRSPHYTIDPTKDCPYLLEEYYDACTGSIYDGFRKYGDVYYSAVILGGTHNQALALASSAFHRRLLGTGLSERQRFNKLRRNWPTK